MRKQRDLLPSIAFQLYVVSRVLFFATKLSFFQNWLKQVWEDTISDSVRGTPPARPFLGTAYKFLVIGSSPL